MKISNKELANLYTRLIRVSSEHNEIFENKFRDIFNIICREINKRNHALIYKDAVRYLKNRGKNQMYMAKNYADAVIDDCNYFESDRNHEIGSYYSKTNTPLIVDLVLSYATI